MKERTLSQRFAAVMLWCSDRDIKPLRFFSKVDPSLEDHWERIRYVTGARDPRITDTDEPWLLSMEATIAALTARKSVAA